MEDHLQSIASISMTLPLVFSLLNKEIILYIFQFLNVEDLMVASLVSKYWKKLIETPSLWEVIAKKVFPTLKTNKGIFFILFFIFFILFFIFIY